MWGITQHALATSLMVAAETTYVHVQYNPNSYKPVHKDCKPQMTVLVQLHKKVALFQQSTLLPNSQQLVQVPCASSSLQIQGFCQPLLLRCILQHGANAAQMPCYGLASG